MKTITVRNVHEALPEGLSYLSRCGLISNSRAGKVMKSPTPVMTVYTHPEERVLFHEDRDANPFFHLMEALWMLSGRKDLAWLSRFNKKMLDFSDDGGKTQSGAYGYRWRRHFCHLVTFSNQSDSYEEIDQLEGVCELLCKSPKSRRAVIQMYDCTVDLETDESKLCDVPCNTHIYLSNNEGELDMTVLCRSNDIIWGAYGANAVHFSILQEYLASKLSWEVGKLYQFSNDYHAYVDIMDKCKNLISSARSIYSRRRVNPYENEVQSYSLVYNPDTFDEELHNFMLEEETPDLYLDVEPDNTFLIYASAMRRAYLLHKFEDKTKEGIELIRNFCPDDWDFGVEGVRWLQRRLERKSSRAVSSS